MHVDMYLTHTNEGDGDLPQLREHVSHMHRNVLLCSHRVSLGVVARLEKS